MGRGPIPMRRPKLPFHLAITARSTFGISPSFLGLSQSSGQVTHVLLTRSRLCPRPKPGSSLHLHVLGTPPAFVLSQDQTLREELLQLHKRVVRGTNPQNARHDTWSHRLLRENLWACPWKDQALASIGTVRLTRRGCGARVHRELR